MTDNESPGQAPADLFPTAQAAPWYVRTWDVPIDPMTYPIFGEDGTVTCSCGKDHEPEKAGKHPANLPGFRNGSRSATRDMDLIATTWQRDPRLGIQIPTGAVSGFVILEVDNEDTFRILDESVGVPDTLMSLSGRGFHLWFKHPGYEVKTRNPAFGRDMPGVEVKGDGGAITAPPSVHPSGLEYMWVRVNGKLIPPAPWPEIFTELMKPVEPPRPARKPRRDFADSDRGRSEKYAAEALDRELAIVLGTLEGGRNDQLNTSAFNVGQLVHEGLLDHDDAFNALLDAARTIGLSGTDAIPTIRSGFRAGAAKPRSARVMA